MKIISNFSLNRSNNIIVSKNNLLKFIKKFCKERNYKFFLKSISKKLDIPVYYLENQTKIYLFLNFINNKGVFNNKFKIFFLFKDSLFFLFKYFYINLISKKKYFTKNYELIIDDIDKDSHTKKFVNLTKKFKTIFFSSVDQTEWQFADNKKKYNVFRFDRYKHCIKDEYIKNNIFIILKLFFTTLICSVNNKNNLFPIIDNIYKNYLIYESLFKQVKAKYLIQERHYNSNEIRNYLFKKNGGICCAITQKNILQFNGPGMFIFTDILFTLGKNSAEDLEILGGKVNKKVPVGSLAMEYSYHDLKKKIKNKVKKYDLIVLCSDNLAPFHSGYESYYQDFYEHYNWIYKFAKKFPHISIGLKNKNITNDKKVIALFKNINNVDFLFSKEKNEGFSNSYFYAEKSKVLCTWISTVGFEFFSENRKTYFLDPGLRNIGFLPNKKFIKNYKISNYKSFEKKIINELKFPKKNINKYNNHFCIKSSNVSQNIYNYLIKIKKVST